MAPLVEFRAGDGTVAAPGIGSESDGRSGYEPPGFRPRGRWRRRYRHNRHLVDLLTGPPAADARGPHRPLGDRHGLRRSAGGCSPQHWSLDDRHGDQLGAARDRARHPADLVLLVAVADEAPRPDARGPAAADGDHRDEGAERAVADRPRDARGDARAGLPATPTTSGSPTSAPDAGRRAPGASEHGVRISTRDGVTAYHQPSLAAADALQGGQPRLLLRHLGLPALRRRRPARRRPRARARLPAPRWSRRSPTRSSATSRRRASATATPKRSWAARGRLYAEATLHGPMQAGHSGGYAPSCIGSHYAVRTAGAAGDRRPRARARRGLHDDAHDELARLAGRLRGRRRGARRRPRVPRRRHDPGVPVVAQHDERAARHQPAATGTAWPARQAPARASARSGIRSSGCSCWRRSCCRWPRSARARRSCRSASATSTCTSRRRWLVLVATVIWLRGARRGCARARREPVSWEMALFQLVRWPWALLGCVHAVVGADRRAASSPSRSRRRAARASLPLPGERRDALPRPRRSSPRSRRCSTSTPARRSGYRTLALLNAVLYLLAADRDRRPARARAPGRDAPRRCSRRSRPRRSPPAACASFIVVGLAPAGLRRAGRRSPRSRAPRPWPRSSTRDAAARRHDAVAGGEPVDAVDAGATSARSTPSSRSRQAHAGIVQWFADWRRRASTSRSCARSPRRGSTPQITWEPWDSASARTAQSEVHARRRSSAGATTRTSARGRARSARFGGPVQLRFAQEMNGVLLSLGRGR